MYRLAIASLLAVALLLALATAAIATPAHAGVPDTSNPEVVTHEFFTWYIQYGRTHSLEGHPYLTSALIERIAASRGAGSTLSSVRRTSPSG
ncbi:MAG: hypothetical protein ACLFVO_24250 [Chloroflexaceae bacterium]